MGYDLEQSSTAAANRIQFWLFSSSDHLTGLTGKAGSVVVKIGKCGATGVSPSGSISEVDSTNLPGLYEIAPNATDSGTAGPLALYAKDAASDPYSDMFFVKPISPIASLVPSNLKQCNGSTVAPGAIPNAAAGALSGLPLSQDAFGRVALTDNAVAAAAIDATGVAKIATGVRSELATELGRIDAEVSSRLAAGSYTAPPSASTNAAAVRNDLATELARMDAAVSSRAATGDAMTLTTGERTAIANEVESQIIDDTDSERVLQAIVDKIASANPSLDDLTLGAIASAVRTELTTELDRIDAAISTRLAAGDYTTPPTASTNASAVRTELTTELGRIDAAISSRATTTGVATQISSDHGSGSYVRNTEPPTEAGIVAAVAAKIITDHGDGSYVTPEGLGDAIETIEQIEDDTRLLRAVNAAERSAADGVMTCMDRDGETPYAQLTLGTTPGAITAVEVLAE